MDGVYGTGPDNRTVGRSSQQDTHSLWFISSRTASPEKRKVNEKPPLKEEKKAKKKEKIELKSITSDGETNTATKVHTYRPTHAHRDTHTHRHTHTHTYTRIHLHTTNQNVLQRCVKLCDAVKTCTCQFLPVWETFTLPYLNIFQSRHRQTHTRIHFCECFHWCPKINMSAMKLLEYSATHCMNTWIHLIIPWSRFKRV